MMIKNVLSSLLIVLVVSFGFSQNKNIVETAMASEDHTTLVTAVKAGDLVETLQAEGPFTVFAPTNAAFDALPAGTVDYLLKPDNKYKLQMVLNFHVIAGKLNAKDVVKAIKDGGGSASVETVGGESLNFSLEGDLVKIADAKGNVATVVAANLNATNGVIHVIDTVLLP